MDGIAELGRRKGLPRDLLFLAEKHPRGTWRGRSELAGAGEVWLGSHDYFRAMTAKIVENLSRLQETGETTYDSGAAFGRHSGGLLGSLEGHHGIEDDHYFPMFRRAEPRLIRGFDILDADHEKIHAAIYDFSARSRDFLSRIGQSEGVMTADQRRATDDMAETAGLFTAILRQHLGDEEDIVIPLIIERAQDDPEFR